ncbi:MAG: HD domain-containing protein [Acidobacteria bacterium]|nr:HD domain-containing protein [Acidobacteriota bacterium]
MFRNNQLLNRSGQVGAESSKEGSLLAAIVAIENKAELQILRPILEKHNLAVLEAERSEVLDLAIRHSARLVVTTLNFSEKAGIDFWQHLLEHDSRETTSFLFITPPETKPEKLAAREVLTCDYVKRPVNLAEFERRLKGVLRLERPKETGGAIPQQKLDSSNVTPEQTEVKHPLRRRSGRFRNALLWQSSLTQGSAGEAVPDEAPTEEAAVKKTAASPRKPAGVPEAAERSPLETPENPDVKLPEVSWQEGVGGLGPAPIPPEQKVELEAKPETGEPEAGREAAAPALVKEQHPGDEGSRAASPGLVGGSAGPLYEEATTFTLASIRRATEAKPVDAARGVDIVRRMIHLLGTDNGLLLLATDRLCEFSLTQSSVNVAIIACHIARTLGLPEERILRVGLAGLLHDVGVVKLPKNLVHRSMTLTDAERTTLEQTPLYSAQILSNLPRAFEWLPTLVSAVHQGESGETLSQGMRQRRLSEEGHILRISVVFEACIHKRPNREAMTGYRTLEELLNRSRTFPDRITKGMIQAFSIYPFNEFVVLNTGEIGQVIDVNRENPMRPTVKLLYTVEGEPFYELKIVNLAQNSSIHVQRAITWRELPSA